MVSPYTMPAAGALGGLGCAENRDTDAVRGTVGPEGHVPFVLNGRPDLLHPRVIGEGHRSLKKIRIHRRMKEIAFEAGSCHLL